MISIKEKQYSTIIWDWRSTLYDPINDKLFDWVIPFFEKHKDMTHILVSFVSDTEKRMKQIERFGMKKYFKYILFTFESKRIEFERIFDFYKEDPKKALVVGDNIHDELKHAKEIGVDMLHVDDFVGLAKPS